jgi:putative ABC transport system permease protein
MGVADDLRYAVRSLGRRPSLTAFAALTLALGVGATTAMFSTIESVVLNPIPYENGDRMAGLFRQAGNVYFTPRPADIELWTSQRDLFETVEPWDGRSMTLLGPGGPRETSVAVVRPTFFDMLGRSPLLGRTFSNDELRGAGARVVLVSHGMWRRELGGSNDVLGSTLELDGEPWTVIGVLPPKTLLPGWGLRTIDIWTPLPEAEADAPHQTLALLGEGVDVEHVNERLAALGVSDDGGSSRGQASLVRDQVGAGVRGYLGLLMGAVLLLLLIACVNVSNLLLFRADARRRETAVRSALGGGRARLTRQLLIESLVLAAVGGALGVALSYIGQAAILELRPSQLDILDYVSINGRVLAFAVALTAGTGVVFGLVPALHAGRPDALATLRSGARTEGDLAGRRLRWVLVSGEVALSFALLLGSLVILATLVERQQTELGFQADEVLVMQVTPPSWRYEDEETRQPLYDEVFTRIARLPGVVHVSRATGIPPRIGVMVGRFQVEGSEPSDDTEMLYGPSVDAHYFATLGQTIAKGRAFTEDDLASQERPIILGETTARRFFADRDPIGGRFRVEGAEDWYTVVGVANDVPMTGLSATKVPLQVYHPLRGGRFISATFLARVASLDETAPVLSLMRGVATSVDPGLRIDRLTVATDLMRDTLERERFATTILATFAALALLLAAVGLYGVVSQVVGRRTREIGIRMALGAGRSSIASMVLRRAGGATAMGLVGGIGLAAGGTRILESQVLAVESDPLVTYSLAALALMLTSLVAAYAPTRRATRVDPVSAMRVE